MHLRLLCCAEDLPPLVLPPIEYPGILAPAAKDININSQIMDLYLNSVLPGGPVGAGGCVGTRTADRQGLDWSRRHGSAGGDEIVSLGSVPSTVVTHLGCTAVAPCPACSAPAERLPVLAACALPALCCCCRSASPLSPPRSHRRARGRRQLRLDSHAGRAVPPGAVEAHPLWQVCGRGKVQVRAQAGWVQSPWDPSPSPAGIDVKKTALRPSVQLGWGGRSQCLAWKLRVVLHQAERAAAAAAAAAGCSIGQSRPSLA